MPERPDPRGGEALPAVYDLLRQAARRARAEEENHGDRRTDEGSEPAAKLASEPSRSGRRPEHGLHPSQG